MENRLNFVFQYVSVPCKRDYIIVSFDSSSSIKHSQKYTIIRAKYCKQINKIYK